MGVRRKQRNVTFFSVSNGMLVKRVNEPTDISESRVLKNGPNAGKTIHEEKFDELTGHITSVGYRSSVVPFQKDPFESIVLIVKDDEGDTFSVEWALSSSYTKSLVGRLPAIDFEEEVVISTHWIENDKGKFRGYLSIEQNGVKLKSQFSQDDYPMLGEIKDKSGKTVMWDDSELVKFYKQVIDSVQSNVPFESEEPSSDNTVDNNNQKQQDDDGEPKKKMF